jgi:hypothetical protein
VPVHSFGLDHENIVLRRRVRALEVALAGALDSPPAGPED